MRQQIFLTAFAFVLFSGQVIAEGTRVELQAGASFGEPEIEVDGVSEDLDTDTGLSIGGNLWLDGIYMQNLSLGLQYNYTTGVDYEESVGGDFLGTPLSASISIESNLHMFMANAVLRDNAGTDMGRYRFHPYLGGGLGVAFVDSELAFSGVFGGMSFSGTEDDDDTVFAGQVMGGFDVDITDRAYIGFNASYLIASDAKLFGADVNFDSFRVMGTLGYKF